MTDEEEKLDYMKHRLQYVYEKIKEEEPENRSLALRGLMIYSDLWPFAQEHLRYEELKSNGNLVELYIDESWTPFIKHTKRNFEGKECWNRLVEAAYHSHDGLVVLHVSNVRLFEWSWRLSLLIDCDNPEVNALLDNEDPRFLNICTVEKKIEYMTDEDRDVYDVEKDEYIEVGAEWGDEDVEKYIEEQLEYADKNHLALSKFPFYGYVLIVLEEGLDLSDVIKYGQKKNNGALEVMLRRYNRLGM